MFASQYILSQQLKRKADSIDHISVLVIGAKVGSLEEIVPSRNIMVIAINHKVNV